MSKVRLIYACYWVWTILLVVFIFALAGCTTITITKPPITYKVTVPIGVDVSGLYINKAGDDYTIGLNKGSTGDIESVVEAFGYGLGRGVK